MILKFYNKWGSDQLPNYKDGFKSIPFKTCKRAYKYLQEPVFEALKALTPSRAAFELSIREESEYKISWDEIDECTKVILGDILCDLLDDEHFIVTSHDLYFAWCRIRDLLYTHKLLEQKLIQENVSEDGSVTYSLVGVSKDSGPKVYRHAKAWARIVTSFTK